MSGSFFCYLNTASSVSFLLAVDWRVRRRLLREKRDRWDPAGAQATRRLIGHPRKAKPCTEINCGVISGSAHVSHLFVFRLDSFGYVPASLYIYDLNESLSPCLIWLSKKGYASSLFQKFDIPVLWTCQSFYTNRYIVFLKKDIYNQENVWFCLNVDTYTYK